MIAMIKRWHPQFGFYSHMTKDGVFAKNANGGERLIFTFEEPEDGNVMVPVLSFVDWREDGIEFFWGTPGQAPSAFFERV